MPGAGAALRAFVTYPRRHVRGRIVLPFAMLTVLLAGGGSYLVTTMVAGTLQERFDNQLVETGRVAADQLVRVEQQQLADARAMAATQGVAGAIADGNSADVAALLEPLLFNSGADWAGAIDDGGVPLFASARRGDGSYERTSVPQASEWWPVKQALNGPDERGDKFASIVESQQGFLLVTAAPVYGSEGIVGAVMSGTYTSTLVDMLKRQSLGDVTLYDYTGRAMSSTLVRDTERDTVLQMSAASVSAVIDSPQTTHRATLSYAGREYDMAYGLLRVRGSIIGIYSVSLSSDYIGIAGQSTRLELSAFVAIAVAAVLTLGIVTSNRITAPIVRLVDAARKLSTGDLSARSAVRSDDEIGILASTFDEMAESLEDYASRLNRQYIGTVKALTTAIDARDPYTLGHSLRVGQLGRALGRELGFSEAQLTHVEVGGYLHDIGKIGVRDAVLLKTGSLTAEEREAIQGHPEIGTSILQSVELAPEVLQIVRGHHERLDGSGYPDALHGEEISLVQRVAAVADVYDALMTARPYKEAMRIEDVLEVMRREAGSLLDERVVGALLRVASAWEERVKNDPTLQGFTIGEPAPRGVRRVA